MQTILLVDDHAIVREPLAKLLRYEGYQVHCASNGQEALAALDAVTTHVVLLDMMLPRMDGLAFLETLRTDSRWHDLRVVVVTGMVECSALARARQLGVTDVLFKAKFTLDELFACIRPAAAPVLQ